MGERKIAADPASRHVEELRQAALANGAPATAAAGIAAAVAPVIAGLPTGTARPPFGAEPGHFLRAIRGCRQ